MQTADEDEDTPEVVKAEVVKLPPNVFDEQLTKNQHPSTTHDDEDTRALVQNDSHDGQLDIAGDDLIARKKELLKRHQNEHGSITETLRAGKISAEDAMSLIVLELMSETDSLKGSELLFTEKGCLRDAATITVKRVESLERVAKTIHRKHLMTQDEVINLDSPHIRLLVTWFLRKVKECMTELKLGNETIEVFFEKLSLATDDWKREVKREIQALQERQLNENE